MVKSDREKPVSLAPLKTAEAIRGLFKVSPETLDGGKSKKSTKKRAKKAGKKKAAPKGRR